MTWADHTYHPALRSQRPYRLKSFPCWHRQQKSCSPVSHWDIRHAQIKWFYSKKAVKAFRSNYHSSLPSKVRNLSKSWRSTMPSIQQKGKTKVKATRQRPTKSPWAKVQSNLSPEKALKGAHSSTSPTSIFPVTTGTPFVSLPSTKSKIVLVTL